MSADDKKRIEWIDIAKGIAILCVIAGHMGVDVLNRVIYTFHIPIFFIISGYFIDAKLEFGEYAKKISKHLLLPYLITSFCLIVAKALTGVAKICINRGGYSATRIITDVYDVFVSAIYGSGNTENKTPYGIQPIGAIWFLLALWWALLIVKGIYNYKYGIIVLGIIAVLSYISSKFVWLPWNIQAGGTAVIFVYLGACVKKYNVKTDISRSMAIIGVCVLLAESVLDVRVSIVRNYYKYTFLSVIGAILISFAVFYFAQKIEHIQILSKPLIFFGENSLIVLCIHLIELNNVPWNWLLAQLNVFPLLQYMTIFACKMILITICTRIIIKIRYWLFANDLHSCFAKSPINL